MNTNALFHLKRRKLALIVTFIIAVVIKSIISYYFFQFDNDKINQAAAAKNFVEGYGLTIKEADPADLSKTLYTPLAGWPPGYSLLLAPIYIITNDIEVSAVILLLISNISFFVVLLKLLLYLKLTLFHIILLLLLPAVSFHEYIVWSTPSDLLAVTACLYACLTALQMIDGKNSLPGFSIAISFSALLRYMYWPISFLLPVILIAIGYKKKGVDLIGKGITGLIIASVICGSIYLFEKIYIGDSLYLYPTDKGFYPENLYRPYPFTVTAVINLDFYAQQLEKLLNLDYTFWIWWFFYLHLLIFILICYGFIKYKLFLPPSFNSKVKYFIMIVGVVYTAILIVLAYISIRNSRHFPPPNVLDWTYISDGRYYIFMLITFPILSLLLLFKYKYKHIFYKGLYLMLVLLICIEIMHGIYYIIKIASPLQPGTKAYIIQKKMETHLKKQIELNDKKNTNTVVASNLAAYPHLSTFYGGAGLFKTDILNFGKIFSSEPFEILLITQESYLQYYKEFIDNPRVRLQIKLDDYYCYSYKP